MHIATIQDFQNPICTETSEGLRDLYQSTQIGGYVAPLVKALEHGPNLDAIWVVPFAFEDMAHPTRPTLKLSVVIRRAAEAAGIEHMRVDSLETARSALTKSSQYSEWTARSCAPMLELLDMAIAVARTGQAMRLRQ